MCDLLSLVVHGQLVVVVMERGDGDVSLRMEIRVVGVCVGGLVFFGVMRADDWSGLFWCLVSAEVFGFLVELRLRRGVEFGAGLLVVFDCFFQREDAPVVDVFAWSECRIPSVRFSERNSTKRLGS